MCMSVCVYGGGLKKKSVPVGHFNAEGEEIFDDCSDDSSVRTVTHRASRNVSTLLLMNVAAKSAA